VTAYQIGLELIELVGWYAHISELAKTGVNPVDRSTGIDRPLYQSPALEQGASGFWLDLDPGGRITGRPNHVVDCK
jgi:hypothetical protein